MWTMRSSISELGCTTQPLDAYCSGTHTGARYASRPHSTVSYTPKMTRQPPPIRRACLCTGGTVGGTAEAGLGITGAAGTVSGGGTTCFDPVEGLSAGVIAQAGYFVNGIAGAQYGPQATGGNFSVGAFIGAGLGPFLSNAKTPADLEGPFDTVSLDLSIDIVPVKISVQVGVSGDIWMAGVTFGPGEGLAASRLVTTTLVKWVGQHQKK
jgi:hypothetical protein